mmetsp:Transcript_122550/g.297434  ORF Transcript_122550/g.297434 Transcript_122550/m.297434 type:complete len:422 (-) Transcript_122550:557-1822(-)
MAKASTRRPFSMSIVISSLSCAWRSSLNSTISPSMIISLQRGVMRSGAPFMYTQFGWSASSSSSDSTIMTWYLLVELNGILPTSVKRSRAWSIRSCLHLSASSESSRCSLEKLMNWANLMMDDSEASPFVSHCITGTMLPKESTSLYMSLLEMSSGSKLAVVFSFMARRNCLKVASPSSTGGSAASSTNSVLKVLLLYTRLAKVMTFMVSVPVLSEQMHVVEPSVSTPSMFFTNTIFCAIDLDVSVRHTVTVASRPSGTLATMIPIMKTRLVMMSVPRPTEMKKNEMPRNMATLETMPMKWWISRLMGVSTFSVSCVSAATLPMKVWSPMARTMPKPVPFSQLVPKKAMFSVSCGFSLVQSGVRSSASGSPVSGALFTFRSVASMITRSAGTWSPALSCTMSPRTKRSASSFTRPFAGSRT